MRILIASTIIFMASTSNLTASMRILTASTSIFVSFKQSHGLYTRILTASPSIFMASTSNFTASSGLLMHFCFKHCPRVLLAASFWLAVVSSTLSWPSWQSRASNDPPELPAESPTLPIEPPFFYRMNILSPYL